MCVAFANVCYTWLRFRAQKLEDEVTKIQEEIAALRKSEGDGMNLPAVNTLSQWFSHYGGSKNATSAPEGFLTSFTSSSKVYGGTNHHPAFRTLSKTMKKGRLI